jgi:hypothetical protein
MSDNAALIGAASLLERSTIYLLGNLHLVRASMLSRPTPCADWDLGTLLSHVEDSFDALACAAEGGAVGAAGPRVAVGAGEKIAAVRAGARRVIAGWSRIREPAVRIESPTGVSEVGLVGGELGVGSPADGPGVGSVGGELGVGSPADEPGVGSVGGELGVGSVGGESSSGESGVGLAGGESPGRYASAGGRRPGHGDSVGVSAAVVATAGAIEIAAHGWDIARACGWRRPVPPALADEMLDLLPLFVAEPYRYRCFAPPAVLEEHACAGDRLIAALGRRPPDPVERRYLQSRAALLLVSQR